MTLSNNLSHQHPSTRALHADDPLNLVTDIAPPIHLSTTFRFPSEPEKLIPSDDPVVCVFHSEYIPPLPTYTTNPPRSRQNSMGRITSTHANLHPMPPALKQFFPRFSTVAR